MTANRFCRLSVRFTFTLLIAVVSLFCAYAQESIHGDVTIRIEQPQTTAVGNGYGEYRAFIANNSPSQTHRVAIVIQGVRRETELAPNAKTMICLFIPNLVSAYEANIEIDGQRLRETALLVNRAGTLETSDGNHGLLLSPVILKSGLTSSSNFVTAFKDSDGNKMVATQTPEFSIAEWSGNWLSYARYDGVVVSSVEWDVAPEFVRTALLRYVERGGALLVAGNWQVPAQWQSRQGFITNDEFKEEDGLYAEASVPVSSPSVPQPEGASDQAIIAQMTKPSVLPVALQAKSLSDPRVYFIGFGAVTVTGASDPGEISIVQWKWMSRNFLASKVPDHINETPEGLNQLFQVVERFGVPVRGLFLLMLLFVIVIGPVNLIWLARRKRKIWLLWTVPAISLMTCLIVASFALFGEGWSATARTEALTILDETAHRATTIGWTAFYSPITPSEGLHFTQDTELSPQLPESYSYRRRAPERTIDWTNDQHLSAGWITARVPVFFKLRKSETRRERLNIQSEAGGAATLVNGLGAEISQVWWADADGKIHTATNVPAGAQARLQATELKASTTVSRLRDAFSTDWLEQFKEFTDKPQEVLMPNSYLAVLEASPFVEEGLKGVKTRKTRNLVYGVSAGGSQ